ncbi:Carbohydrate binding family 6 [Cellulophaga algicola DSM 14237]|uniref:Carbohydrate binding family 6 n=1 Tax=Cellulophaga algicola (strain DSM 14237 / IC166 / ACAM 630) TaxID=688270 RepID=E6X939_CELAD|nr:carbohydrate-binding protein [Cellulophaga algicola]ADV50849.1 Carbohydrate binding family 6 [Cellulophaga algicola DSM 14237]
MMNFKSNIFLSSRYLILFSLVVFSSCDEETREVTLYDKGQTESNASTTSIAFGEAVSFTSSSTKAVTTDWTFQGGTPATSINSDVSVVYNTPGTFEAVLVVKYIDNSIETKNFTIIVDGVDEPLPFGGIAVSLEGVIEAENYDLGGEGIGYHDVEEENLAVTNGSAVYRDDDGMDIAVGTTVTNVGYINEGEWANYTVSISEAGTFNFDFVVASGATTGGNSIKLQAVDQETGEITALGETGNFANTGGWGTYTTITVPQISLEEGSHTLRLYFTGGGTNLDKINVSAITPAGPIDGLAIFSEQAIINANLGETPVNNGSFVITKVTENVYEGTEAYLYEFDPVNSGNTGNGFALSIMAPTTSPMDATGNNFYNIALKSSSTKNLRLRINTSAGNYWVTLSVATPEYGLLRDGEWHLLKIPFTDFKLNGSGPDDITANLDKITGCLVMRSDDGDFATYSTTPGAFNWYVDNVYMSVE